MVHPLCWLHLTQLRFWNGVIYLVRIGTGGKTLATLPSAAFPRKSISVAIALFLVLTELIIFGATLMVESAFAIKPKPLTENSIGDSRARARIHSRLTLNLAIELNVKLY
jgi:hypothetical protein